MPKSMLLVSKGKPRFHYAWVVAFGCAAICATGTVTLVTAMGLFIKPVSEAMGFSRAGFSLVYSFSALVTMFFSPVMGRLLREYSPRLLMLMASAGAAVLLFLFSLCTELYHFYIVGALTGFCTSGVSTLAVSTMLNKWFHDKKGFALGLASAGSGFGAMILTPIISYLMEEVNWTYAFVLEAGVMLVIAVPVCIFLLRDDPATMGLEPYTADHKDGRAARGPDLLSLTYQQSKKLSAFWLLAGAVFLCGVLGQGMQQHVYAFLTDVGYSVAYAARISSLMMAFLIGGKMFAGYLFDRMGMSRGAIVIGGCYFVCACCLFFAVIPGFTWVFTVLFGLAYTVLTIMPSFLTVNMFGLSDYSANYGMINLFLYAGMSLGPPLSALIYDRMGTYYPAWILYAVLVVVMSAMVLYAVSAVEKVKASLRSTAIS